MNEKQTHLAGNSWLTLVWTTASMFLAGCGAEPSAQLSGGQSATRKPAGQLNVGTTAASAARTLDEAQLTIFTNQFATAQQAQMQATRQVLDRMEQLEKKAAEQAAAAEVQRVALQKTYLEQLKAHEERAAKFAQQIGALEARVSTLQAAAAVTPDDGPTTRELDQKIRIAERNRELATETADAKEKEQPRLSASANGFALSSADTNFVLKLRGLVQLDARAFLDDHPLSEGNDSFLLRRARPIFEGTVARDFDFQFVPDFGGSSVQIFDAWLNYRYRPELQLKAGKFKGPVGQENLQSDATLPFNERSLVSNFVPTRHLGVSLWGELSEGFLSYALGVFNVVGDGRNASTADFGDDKEFAGGLFLRPFKKTGIPGLQGFGFGVGGSYSQVSSNAAGLPNTSGGTRPGYVTSGVQQFFAYNPAGGTVAADGAQWRISPHFTTSTTTRFPASPIRKRPRPAPSPGPSVSIGG